MQIFVDMDACPVVKIVEKLAKKYEVPCMLLSDTSHVLMSDYSKARTIGASSDAVDFALIDLCHLEGDESHGETDCKRCLLFRTKIRTGN